MTKKLAQQGGGFVHLCQNSKYKVPAITKGGRLAVVKIVWCIRKFHCFVFVIWLRSIPLSIPIELEVIPSSLPGGKPYTVKVGTTPSPKKSEYRVPNTPTYFQIFNYFLLSLLFINFLLSICLSIYFLSYLYVYWYCFQRSGCGGIFPHARVCAPPQKKGGMGEDLTL